MGIKHQGMLQGMAIVLSVAIGAAAFGPEFGASCAILSGLFLAMRKYVMRCTKAQKWLLAVLSVALVAPGSVWLTLFAAGLIAACFVCRDLPMQTAQVAGFAVLAVFSAIGLLPLDAWATETTNRGLADTVGSLKGVLESVADVVPVFGYAAGAGFGGTGLVEIVKSKQGQGGDFGAGMKKVLIGGGLAGLGGMLDMASTDMTGETAGSHQSPFATK